MHDLPAGSELRAGLLQACDDPRLFAFGLWPRQRELLEAVEAGPRLHVWALGRRSGKSTMAGITGLWDCLLRPELDKMVRRGETRYSVSVATNISQARLIISAARSVIEYSPALNTLLTGSTEDELRFTLPNGAKTCFRAFPCSSRGGRGWPISTLVLDEMAFFLSESDGDRAAQRVWEGLVPSTAQFGDHARVIGASTPFGQSGLFAELWARADSGQMVGAVAQAATTAQMNPTITDEFLAAEEQRDPDSFGAEYLAQFRGSGAAFIDFDRVPTGVAKVAKPEDGYGWVCGLDPAFSKDPFGFAMVGRAREGDGLILGPVGSLTPEGEFSGPVDEIARMATEYRAALVTDQYSAAAVIERLRHHHGCYVRQNTMTAISKTQIFQELRQRLYDGRLPLPVDNSTLVGELQRLRTKFDAGSASVVNPRVGGSHGDMAQALALAVWEQASTVTNVQAPRVVTRPNRYAPLRARPGAAMFG